MSLSAYKDEISVCPPYGVHFRYCSLEVYIKLCNYPFLCNRNGGYVSHLAYLFMSPL